MSGYFHFYYAVRQFIRSQWVEGRVELAPLRNWAPEGTRFHVAVLVNSGNASAANGST
ncbi:hypothetical protein JXA70_11275 [candidate division KSB1 bacterium]|nr:hypothetical protein [candidate division KSB1 bacterium]